MYSKAGNEAGDHTTSARQTESALLLTLSLPALFTMLTNFGVTQLLT